MAAGDVDQRGWTSTVKVPTVPLSSGKPMPRVGLGTATATFATAEGHTGVKEAVLHAIGAGYRHFDTAAVNLCMEYVDLYLIHHPVSQRPPKDDGNMVLVKEDLVEMDMKGVWEEMEECQRRGLAKAIGVSNFACKKLENLLSFANIPPVVNQVEVNPYCRQKKLREFCRARGIQLCGYSPLGANGATAWANSSVMESPVLKQIAQDRCKSVAQVCIRWVYEQGDVVIVKSFNESRMRENLDIFDWELTDDDRRKISELPESRGLYNFLVHESGPYRTVEELWDGEITAGHCNQTTFVSSG
nr:unnamed protein product [Digitaria exilis]